MSRVFTWIRKERERDWGEGERDWGKVRMETCRKSDRDSERRGIERVQEERLKRERERVFHSSFSSSEYFLALMPVWSRRLDVILFPFVLQLRKCHHLTH